MALKEKINIDDRYPYEAEWNRKQPPYTAFYNTMADTIEFESVGSLCDVGCANGWLIHEVKQNNPRIRVSWYEYFDYHLKNSQELISKDINIWDIREPLPDDCPKHTIVVCTEVGEHIEAEYAGVMLDNIKKLLEPGGALIISWASTGGEDDPDNDPYHQHLNPLQTREVHTLLQSRGFIHAKKESDALVANSMKYEKFYDWWRQSLGMWVVSHE